MQWYCEHIIHEMSQMVAEHRNSPVSQDSRLDTCFHNVWNWLSLILYKFVTGDFGVQVWLVIWVCFEEFVEHFLGTAPLSEKIHDCVQTSFFVSSKIFLVYFMSKRVSITSPSFSDPDCQIHKNLHNCLEACTQNFAIIFWLIYYGGGLVCKG